MATAAELKERLQKISKAKDLGKLTYEITGGSASTLILHFEKFDKTGPRAFHELSKRCGDDALAENLCEYFYNKLSNSDPNASNLGCGRGDIISVPISEPDDVPQLEKAAKDLIF